MSYINKKTEDKIRDKINNLIDKELKNNFTNSNNRLVTEVNQINLDFEFDDELSNRDTIILNKIFARADVIVNLQSNEAFKKEKLSLMIINPVILEYNYETEEYEISNEITLIEE